MLTAACGGITTEDGGGTGGSDAAASTAAALPVCPELVGLAPCGERSLTPDPSAPCVVTLDERPPELQEVTLAVDCRAVTRSASDDDGSSFRFTDDSLSIVIEGRVCAALERGHAARIDLYFGCAYMW